MNMRALFALMVTIASASTASAVESEPGNVGVIAVAPPPGPDSALVELTARLRHFLRQRIPGVLQAAALAARMSNEASAASLSETDRMYQAARDAHLNGDPHGAIAQLHTTIRLIESLPEGAEAFQRWKRATLRLAQIQSQLAGQEEQASATIERLLRADEAIQIDPNIHGPELARQLEAVKKQLDALPRHQLVVTSSPADVRVFINGREVGSTAGGSLKLSVVHGRYRITGLYGMLRAPLTTVDVKEDREVALDFRLLESLRPSQGPGVTVAPSDQARIIEVGELLDVGTLAAVHIVEQQGSPYLVGTTYDIPEKRRLFSGVAPLSKDMSVIGGLDALANYLVTGELDPRQPVMKYDASTPIPREQIFKHFVAPEKGSTTAGWVAFSTGIGAVALTGISLSQVISSNSSYENARRLLSPDGSVPFQRTAYDQFIADRDAANRRAVITGVAAGACLVATGILGYLAYKQNGVVGPFRF